MKLSTLTVGKKKSTEVEVNDVVFAADYNEGLIHQIVTAYRAKGRAGTQKQKTRSEVRGGGAKPWRQKGTGRARHGTIRSPIWRGGGVTFAARPRDYSQKVNKKMFRAAMKSILSELYRQGRLLVVESFDMTAPKTKEMLKALQALDLTNVLIVKDNVDENTYLAARNIPHVDVRDVVGADPVSLLSYQRILVTVPALRQFEEWLA